MKKILTLLFCSIFFFYTIIGFSQAVYEEGIPYTFEHPTEVKSVNAIPVELMPELDYDKLLKEDEKDDAAGMAPRFGFLHEVNYSLENAGHWERLPNGDRIWRLSIFAPKARTININYSKYNVPFGGKLFIYNKDKTEVLGPFTRENEKINGEFATGFTKGEECTIEYYEPRNAIGKSTIEISGIVHGYKSIRSFVDDFLKDFNSSGPCNNDVNCAMGAAWEEQIKSVALHILANGTRWCSGALINNTAGDCKPYFLTADHCFSQNAGSVLNDMFVFNYHSPTPACPGTPTGDGSTSESITGGTIVAKASNSDFCLIELSANPLDFYDVYYSGWDRENTAASSAVGIHHPAGDVKKISFENDPLESTSYSSTTQGANLTHWRVPDWDAGTTEGGSSGSPLFDQTTKRIIGQLHGGGAACSGSSNNGLADWYGKIWYSWDQNGATNTQRLAPWLDPIGTGVMFMDNTNCSTPMPPTAEFNPTDMTSFSFCAASDIQFNNASTGVPTSWSWTFSGAGVSPTTSSDPSPVVTVSSSGQLTATLDVMNALGTDSKTHTYPINFSTCTTDSTCDSPTTNAIPDNNNTGLSSDIVITNSATITDLDVDLNITHTYIGDLTISISFNGTTVVLVNEPSCNSNDIVDVTFDDSSTNGTFSANACTGGTSASPAYTGTYNPANPLSAFNGMDQAGTWTITVVDGAGVDTGTLDEWCLTLTTASGGSNCFTDLNNTNGLGTNETGVKVYESTSFIHTTAPTVIQSGAQVDYNAATEIELNADFEVQVGAIFNAFIDGCGGVNVSDENDTDQ